ncbi:YtxH domain-containing protein [Actinomadura hibisca]|uniref:YtxH domain-containing protein n=1 Tax=Actinomadura hibisca TaxID=68565 RepID=UPI000835A44D|nr:YtxH domain-containing protein [Actinomadura hibisca]
MKVRTPFIIGAAVGYVLGTKAGRERYEQILGVSQRVKENPRVQETAGVLRTKGGELAGTAREKAGPLVDKVPAQIGDKIPGMNRGSSAPAEYQDPRRETPAQP